MRDGRLTGITFGDGEYDFRLAWGQLVELQERCSAGPLFVLNRLNSGEWRIEDISNVIRLGLVGGGMSPTDALTKVRRYVEERPPLENHTLAVVVLQAALMGSPEEAVGERVDGGKSNGRVIDDLPNGKIRFADIYGTGAAIGFTPQEVNEMTMWQFMAAVDGYVTANSSEDNKGMSKKEQDDVWRWMQTKGNA